MNHYEALRGLLQRYARAVDARDMDRLEALFHPEAEIKGSQGVQDLGAWLESMRAPRSFPQSMHLLGDPIIELLAGDSSADLDTYAVVHQLSEPGSGKGDLTLGMRYFDRAVLYEGRWVIARRDARMLWMR